MRYIKLVMMLSVLAAVLLAGCGGSNNEPTALPDAHSLLVEATSKIQNAESFRMEIDVKGYPVVVSVGNFPLPQDLPLVFQYADGVFVAPDSLQAKVQVSLGDLATTVDWIAISDKQYMNSDVLTNNKWIEQQIIVGFTPQSLMSPDGGIAHALDSIDSLEMVGKTDLDGLEVYHLTGTILAGDVYSLTFGLIGTTEGALNVDVYISPDEHQVEQVVMHEPLPANVEDQEQEPTTWTIAFMDYNQPFTIASPTLEPAATEETN